MENKLPIPVDDFIDLLLIRNQLVYRSLEEIDEICQIEEQYGALIDSIAILLESDTGFLYLEESAIPKIEGIIDKYRFHFTNLDYTRVVNDIIGGINIIKSEGEQEVNSRLEHYLCWHENVRKVTFRSEEDFIITLADDAIVYHMFSSGEPIAIPSIIIYSSLNYFSEMCPEIFMNSILYDNAMQYLDTRLSKLLLRPVERSCIKKTKDVVQKVKKEF